MRARERANDGIRALVRAAPHQQLRAGYYGRRGGTVGSRRRLLVVRRKPMRAARKRCGAFARNRIVAIENRLRTGREDAPLGFCQALGRAHDFQVRVADVGQHRDVGRCDPGERLDLPVVARAQFDDNEGCRRIEPREELCDADFVVFVGLARGHRPGLSALEQLSQEAFGRRLARAARDRDDAGPRSAPRDPGESEIRELRVRHQQRRDTVGDDGPLRDDQCRSAALERLRDEGVPVETFAA